jgi:hypothetical protein
LVLPSGSCSVVLYRQEFSPIGLLLTQGHRILSLGSFKDYLL